MPNLLKLAPKLDEDDWKWINFITNGFKATTWSSRPNVNRLMLLDLDDLKLALSDSLARSVTKREIRLYKKLFGCKPPPFPSWEQYVKTEAHQQYNRKFG